MYNGCNGIQTKQEDSSVREALGPENMKSYWHHVDNPYLAILTPESCMMQWAKTRSLDAADWHID